jgi:Protein of unknown function (DUF1579)
MRIFVSMVILLASYTLVRAAPPVTEPQAAYEPRSEPGDGQRFLSAMVGDWDVVKTFYPKAGSPVALSGTCRQTMINDGRFLKSEFVFGGSQNQTVGLGLIGFDSDTGLFTSVWTDSRSTRFSIRQSEGKFDGKEIVLLSRSVDGPTTRPTHTSRTVTHLENDGSKIVHQQFAHSADGSDRLMMEIDMPKRGPTTEPVQ